MITAAEYAPYYEQYIDALQNNGKTIIENLLESEENFAFRGANESWSSGVARGMWWAAVTITTVGYLN